MGGLRKLKRGQDRKYADAIAKIVPRYDRKLSEVLLEFADPLVVTARTEEDFHNSIEIAVLAWNLSFLPADEQSTFLRESVTPLSGREELPFEAEQCIQMLLTRKQALFSSDRRFVIQHQVSGGPHDGKLIVAYEMARQ